MEGVVRTSFVLPAELQALLRETADRIGRSQSDLVREALKTYLAGLQPPPPQCIGIAEDSELSGEDAERWLFAQWDKDRAR